LVSCKLIRVTDSIGESSTEAVQCRDLHSFVGLVGSSASPAGDGGEARKTVQNCQMIRKPQPLFAPANPLNDEWRWWAQAASEIRAPGINGSAFLWYLNGLDRDLRPPAAARRAVKFRRVGARVKRRDPRPTLNLAPPQGHCRTQ
jgi:hypothetical protein